MVMALLQYICICIGLTGQQRQTVVVTVAVQRCSYSMYTVCKKCVYNTYIMSKWQCVGDGEMMLYY